MGSAEGVRGGGLREQAQPYPPPPRLALLRTIHLQARDARTADRSAAADRRPLAVYPEMAFPRVSAWMKQRHLRLALTVLGCFKVGFEEVAGMAGEREVLG